ncbi:MAG: phosphoglycerate kinase [Candidatus Peregrinibacteria bacterium]|nr:phosphoglycerate kinase [Candidatus Peregrinibacteria bacterium]
MKINAFQDVDVKSKRVLLRVDFNVPMNGEVVADGTRLEAALPTIEHLVKAGARVVLMSHFGRPDSSNPDPSLKMDVIAKAFEKLLGQSVKKLDGCVGADVEAVVGKMKDGDVVMLENTRFHEGEKKNDHEFSKGLAALGDLYVNDAFGAVHRAHASTVGVAAYLPAYAGFLIQKEVEVLTPLLKDAPKPLVLIMGGAKIDTKIGILKNFMDRADTFLIGGGLANTFLYAAGFDVGESLCQKDKMELAQQIMLDAEAHHEKFLIPIDVIVASEISETAVSLDIPVEDVEMDMKILDIGKLTIERFLKAIEGAATIVWNGPVGLYEMTPFSRGTKSIAEAVSKSKATTILGGGDTIDAIKKFGHKASEFDHVSTGGGAMLEFLEGKELPGITVLKV